MAINMRLATDRGISEESIKEIERLQDLYKVLIPYAVENKDRLPRQSIVELLTCIDFQLQTAWGWSENKDYHTLVPRYLFKCKWANTTWMCKTTGEKFTIPTDVEPCYTYTWADAFIDVGRGVDGGGYYRTSNCVQV